MSIKLQRLRGELARHCIIKGDRDRMAKQLAEYDDEVRVVLRREILSELLAMVDEQTEAGECSPVVRAKVAEMFVSAPTEERDVALEAASALQRVFEEYRRRAQVAETAATELASQLASQPLAIGGVPLKFHEFLPTGALWANPATFGATPTPEEIDANFAEINARLDSYRKEAGEPPSITEGLQLVALDREVDAGTPHNG